MKCTCVGGKVEKCSQTVKYSENRGKSETVGEMHHWLWTPLAATVTALPLIAESVSD